MHCYTSLGGIRERLNDARSRCKVWRSNVDRSIRSGDDNGKLKLNVFDFRDVSAR